MLRTSYIDGPQYCSLGAGPAADGASSSVAVAVGAVEAAEQLGDARLESAEVVLGQIGAEGRESTGYLSALPVHYTQYGL